MLDEVLDALDRAPAGPVVDATLGGAGHAVALLDRRDDITLHGVDQDEIDNLFGTGLDE